MNRLCGNVSEGDNCFSCTRTKGHTGRHERWTDWVDGLRFNKLWAYWETGHEAIRATKEEEKEVLSSPLPSIGRKDDAGKPRFDLFPSKAEKAIVDVLTFGANKYAPDNWRKVEGWRWRYYRAARGHIWAWATGEKLDKESGLPHLAHAVCCLLFLLELDE